MNNLRFGTFIAPIHARRENPTLCIERDIQLIEHLDRLGFDEAWLGEHHSGGAELIASPELIIAVAAERTKYIRLGAAGSLPYHNPFILADQFLQLHHMTRGRAMFGACYSPLASDAKILGVPQERQPKMVEEALDCIIRLFEGETVTYKSDWFELSNALLQMRPYGGRAIEICTNASPIQLSGPQRAGKHGIGLLSFRTATSEALEAAAAGWQVACDIATQHGRKMDRSNWRIVGVVHVADTREQALEDVRFGLDDWLEYTEEVLGLPYAPGRKGDPAKHLMDTGVSIIGTPGDCIRQIEKIERGTGGFGCYLLYDFNWASFERKLKSYELIARYVIPHFQKHNTQREDSSAWVQKLR